MPTPALLRSWPGKGDVRDLRPGEYMRSASRVWYRCASLDCGSIDEIGSHDYGIASDGRVMPEYACQSETCGQRALLKLEGWKAFDTSDVERAG